MCFKREESLCSVVKKKKKPTGDLTQLHTDLSTKYEYSNRILHACRTPQKDLKEYNKKTETTEDKNIFSK